MPNVIVPSRRSRQSTWIILWPNITAYSSCKLLLLAQAVHMCSKLSPALTKPVDSKHMHAQLWHALQVGTETNQSERRHKTNQSSAFSGVTEQNTCAIFIQLSWYFSEETNYYWKFQVNKHFTYRLDVYWWWRSPASVPPFPDRRRHSRLQRGRCSWRALQNLIWPQTCQSGRAALGWNADPARMAHTVSRRCRWRLHHSAGTGCCKWCPSCRPSHSEASTARREPCRWRGRPGSWGQMEALKKERDDCYFCLQQCLMNWQKDNITRIKGAGNCLTRGNKTVNLWLLAPLRHLSREPLTVSVVGAEITPYFCIILWIKL